jgi:hypothetical protein
LTGATGATGVQGPTGPQGPQGPAGTDATIPAALTNLNTLYTEPWSGFNVGTDPFIGGNGTGGCTLGDMLLSTNQYGSGSYLPADGRVLSINQYAADFSILGTRFGGNGSSNFALPDLRNFAPPGLYWSICMEGVFPSRN